MFFEIWFIKNFDQFSSVQKGIALFKEERNQDAILCYNKALSIDEENVEAYVARGAL